MFHRYGALPIASDMGDCLFTAMDMEYTELVAPGYYATMGYGVPSGLGVQAATGRRPLILVGDGAFQMTGMELLNCRRYGWNPIVLVFNNSSWEMLRAFSTGIRVQRPGQAGLRRPGQQPGRPRPLGRYEKKSCTPPLEQAFEDDTCFQLIDISLARGLMSNTLSRFVAGFKQMRDG